MTRIGWVGIVICVIGVGCGEHRPPVEAPPAQERTLRLPADAVAVLEVDLPRLRASALWYLARRVIERQSSFAASCPDAFASAKRVTLALGADDHGEGKRAGEYMILRGVDDAALRACLARRPLEIPDGEAWDVTRERMASVFAGGEPTPGTDRPDACQRFDRAVHTFAACGVVPRSVAAELHAAQDELALAPTSGAAAVCARALSVVEQANARRAALDWPCEHPRNDLRSDALRPLGDGTYAVDGEELVRVVDDHTVIMVRGHRVEPEVLQRELRAMLDDRGPPRWFDTARLDRGADRFAWLALDGAVITNRHILEEGTKAPPERVFADVSIHGDVSLHLRFVDARWNGGMMEWFAIARRLLDEPMLKTAVARVSCAGSASTGARAARCAALVQHAEEVYGMTGRETEAMQFLAGAVQQSAIASCAELSEAELACREHAKTTEDYGRCPVSGPREPPSYNICGAHELVVDVQVPLPLIEAAKLHELSRDEARADCRTQGTGAAIVENVRLREGALRGAVCFDKDRCWSVRLGGKRGPQWDSREGEEVCHAPFQFIGPGLRPARCPETNAGPSMRDLEQKDVHVCSAEPDRQCGVIRPSRPVTMASASRDGRYAALVVGKPGSLAVETWDVRAGKRLARWPAGATAARPCVELQMLGATVMVSTGRCAAVERGSGTLFTVAGARLAAAGDAAMASLPPVSLGEQRWAFVATTGDQLVVQDVTSGRLEPRVALGAAVEPGMVSVDSDQSGTVAVAYGGKTARSGSVSVVDSAGVRAIAALPVCPPSAEPD